jgi:PAS domain S-box-containing protein
MGVKADVLYADGPDILADMARCASEQCTLHRYMRYRFRTTGEEKDFSVTYVYLPPDLVMIHTEDVTERVRAETALRETNDMLQSLILASPLAIITLDRDDNVTTWNPAAERIFGWTESEVLKRPLPLVSEDGRHPYQSLRQADLQGDYGAALETKVVRKNGSLVDVSLWTAPVRDAGGLVTRTIGILADNTERKQAESQLHENADRLLALSRRLIEVQELERRHVAGELHDEIGQYLTGLGVMLELSGHTLSDEGRRKIEKARAITKELTGKVRDLSLRLRPTMLDDLGLVPALLWHFDRFTAQTQVHVSFEHSGLERRLGPRRWRRRHFASSKRR